MYIALVTTQQSTPDFLRILRGVFHDKDSWKKKQAETRHFSDETTTRSASVSSSSLSSSINVPSNPPSSSSSGSSSSQRSRAPSQKRNAPVVISHASNIVVSSLLQCALLPQSQVSKNIAAGPTNNNELATSSSSSNQGVKRRHRLYPVDGEPCAKKLASPVRAPNSSYDTSTSPAASGNISIVTFNDAHLGHRK